MSSDSSSPTKSMNQLTPEELARMERNRQKALLLRQEKQKKLSTNELYSNESKMFGHSSGGQDSGGGFLLSDDSDDERTNDRKEAENPNCGQSFECIDCKLTADKSFLFRHFSVKVCDQCKDLKDKHSLITRTEAKTEYLLKDCDLDKREPPLRFLAKKNPHQFARGDMKLYLRFQVEDRALEVWGSEDNLEEERDKRNGMRHKRKQKEYDKRLKNLRMSVRSSLYTKQNESHCHEFDDEVYNEEEDLYEKRCKTCGHLDSYEKM